GSPRAQADKRRYHERMLEVLVSTGNLEILEGEVDGILHVGGRVTGVTLAGGKAIGARRVVLALGTFPNGLMHIGERTIPGGREGEQPSCGLSDLLADAGFTRARLKTGTPPRLRRETIDFSRCEEQRGDEAPEPFSYRTASLDIDQVSCHITWTGEATHEIVRRNLDRAPLFSGQIKGKNLVDLVKSLFLVWIGRPEKPVLLKKGDDTFSGYPSALHADTSGVDGIGGIFEVTVGFNHAVAGCHPHGGRMGIGGEGSGDGRAKDISEFILDIGRNADAVLCLRPEGQMEPDDGIGVLPFHHIIGNCDHRFDLKIFNEFIVGDGIAETEPQGLIGVDGVAAFHFNEGEGGVRLKSK
ncbi:MAG: FAD-dependent oxidoreductase, partial [Acidobacteria bacterium]|nr:FAD-dependent oxidoreductase [Acidobacteriota bacterium]